MMHREVRSSATYTSELQAHRPPRFLTLSIVTFFQVGLDTKGCAVQAAFHTTAGVTLFELC
jgi:hypothetical protein